MRAIHEQIEEDAAHHQAVMAARFHDLHRHTLFELGEIQYATRQRLRHLRSVQAGNALPSLLALIAAAWSIAFIAGAFGPALQQLPDRRGEFRMVEQELITKAMTARWEADAQRRCASGGGDNTGYIATADGGIVCTDKRGRRQLARGGKSQ